MAEWSGQFLSAPSATRNISRMDVLLLFLLCILLFANVVSNCKGKSKKTKRPKKKRRDFDEAEPMPRKIKASRSKQHS
nr:unnamed protein product [Haemonchus contortus]